MKRSYKILIGIVVVLVIIRLILPYVILHFANDRLKKVKGYYGHIEDIDLSLYRGAYIINDIYLNKLDSVSERQTEFFKSHDIDLSVEWESLLHGSINGELVFDAPVLIFTKDKAEIGQVKNDTNDFRKLLKSFMPLKINRFEVNDGEVHYIDKSSTPKVNIALKETHILALNLSNVVNKSDILPSTVKAEASVYEGTLRFDMRLNPLAEQTTFDLNAEIQNVNLVLLNDFLRAYGKFDINKGRFGLYTEMAARGGSFKGYVKPIIKDLDVVGPKDRHDNIFHKLWEYTVGGVGVIFRNQKKDQIATKVTIEGNFKDPHTGTLDAIWQVIRNAFIQALMPTIDNEININSVGSKEPEKKSFLGKIFSSDKEKEKSKKDKNDNKETSKEEKKK